MIEAHIIMRACILRQFAPLANAKIQIFYKTHKKNTDYPKKRRIIYTFLNIGVAFVRWKKPLSWQKCIKFEITRYSCDPPR